MGEISFDKDGGAILSINMPTEGCRLYVDGREWVPKCTPAPAWKRYRLRDAWMLGHTTLKGVVRLMGEIGWPTGGQQIDIDKGVADVLLYFPCEEGGVEFDRRARLRTPTIEANRDQDVYSIRRHDSPGVGMMIPASTFGALFEEVMVGGYDRENTPTPAPDGAGWGDASVEVWKNVSHAAEHGPPGPATFARALLELRKRDLVRYAQMNKLGDAMGIDPEGMEQNDIEALECEVGDIKMDIDALEAKVDHIAVTDG